MGTSVRKPRENERLFLTSISTFYLSELPQLLEDPSVYWERNVLSIFRNILIYI